MWLAFWVRDRKFKTASRGQVHHKAAARYRPEFDVLEGRTVASTLTVNTPLDVVDPNDGVRSLREAVAQAAVKGDTIDFNLGSGAQTITLTNGKLLLDKSLTITGPGADNLSVSAGGVGRVFEIPARMKVNISGLTIRDGAGGYQFGGDVNHGGAIRNAGTLTLTNCTLSNNHAGVYGGAIYNIGSLTVSGCTITGNTVGENGSAYGGGIYNIGNVTITNSVLSYNSANPGSGFGNGNGGAICNYLGGTMKVSGSTFTGNYATVEGGAIHNVGTLTVTGSDFTGNIAQFGGAIMNRKMLTIGSCTFLDNTGGDVVNLPGAKIRWL